MTKSSPIPSGLATSLGALSLLLSTMTVGGGIGYWLSHHYSSFATYGLPGGIIIGFVIAVMAIIREFIKRN